jgi:hypothetical protein
MGKELLQAQAALPSGKEQPMLIEKETGWTPRPVWTVYIIKISYQRRK